MASDTERETLERQWNEYEALIAIFDGDEHITLEFSSSFEALRRFIEEQEEGENLFGESPLVLLLRFPCSDIPSVRICIPKDYPTISSPEIELAKIFIDRCEGEVKEIVATSQGEECLFQVIQLLKETVSSVKEEQRAANRGGVGSQGSGSGSGSGLGSEKADADQSDGGQVCSTIRAEDEISVIHGNAFTEKKSTFQAHCAHVSSMAEVEQVMSQLLSIKKLASATHNMMAYRIECDGATLLQDYDDDGEAAAGNRMLHLLQVVKAVNVVVVVSRWYGGIKLGPARFSIINNVARELLAQCGFIKDESSKSKKGKKSKGQTKGM